MLSFIRSKGKWLLSLGVLILLIILGVLGYGFLRIDKSLIKDLVVVKRTVYAQEKSTGGLLAMTFNRDNQKYQYVNVAIDFNKDGEFSSYQTDNQAQEEWVVENMEPKIKKDEGLGLAIPLTDLDIDNQKDFPVKIIFSTKKLANWQGEQKFSSATLSSTIKAIEKNDLSEIYQPDPEKIRSGGFFGDFSASNVYASENDLPQRPANINDQEEALTGDGQSSEDPASDQNQSSGEGSQGQSTSKEKTVQSLAKEFDASHSNMPDLDQKKNECAPMATANSLLWLAAKGEYLDKLPQTAPELIAKLKTNFKWTENGVDVQKNYLEGKATTISQLGLPLETHAVGKPFDLNIVAKIAQEIAKGQDVEIDLAYYEMNADGTGERIGGHMVTVVGARGTRDAQYLDIHDPATTGENKTETYKINGTNVVGYTSGTTTTFIRYAIAESPITPPATPIDDSSTTEIPTSDITITTGDKPSTTTTPSTTTNTTTTPTTDSTNTTNNNSNTSSTTATTSTPTPTPTPTSTSEEPTFSGLYETGTNETSGYLNLMATPTNLASQNFYGMQIDLSTQNPAMTSPNSVMSNVNLEGWNDTSWACSINGTIIRCHGNKPMIINVKSIITLYYPLPFNLGLPNPIIVYILDANGNAKYRVVVNQQ